MLSIHVVTKKESETRVVALACGTFWFAVPLLTLGFSEVFLYPFNNLMSKLE